MKKSFIRKTLCIMIACVFMFTAALPAFASTPAEDAHLHFNRDGKFRILVFSDIQDDETLDVRLKTFLRQAVYAAQPDLIVLTGDNIVGDRIVNKQSRVEAAIAEFMEIFKSIGIPVAIVFGNHDDEGGTTKEAQMEMYNKYSVSISYNEGESINGCGTYNVPIYGSQDTDKVKFNLWMFDSGSDENGRKSDYVRPSQLNWFVQKSNELKAANGGVPVPSIAFQHIIVKEIYDALDRVQYGTSGAVQHGQRYYVLPNTAAPGSVMNEAPSPCGETKKLDFRKDDENNEFEVLQQQGGVRAIVCGHDHLNQFVVPYQGIDLINTPGLMMYDTYSDPKLRGARIIDLDEQTGKYETHMLYMRNLLQAEYYTLADANQKYVKNVALCIERSARHGSVEAAKTAAYDLLSAAVDAANGNGVVLREDLNGGATNDKNPGNHDVVCMGYTFTTDEDEAMRGFGLCFTDSVGASGAGYDGASADGRVWNLCGANAHFVSGTDGVVNLNSGTNGNAIYFVANYDSTASPLTSIRIVNTDLHPIDADDYPDYYRVQGVIGSGTGADYADLNKSALGDYIYALYKTAADSAAQLPLDSLSLREAYYWASVRLNRPDTLYSAESTAALQEALAAADAIMLDLDDGETTEYNQAALDAATDRITACVQGLETASFTVTFNANGGICDEKSRTFVYGAACGELPIARKDYRFLPLDSHFDGWFTERTGGEQITPETIFTATSDQTWYAHWSSAAGIVGPQRPIEVVPQHPFDDSLQPAIDIAGKDNFDLDHQKYVPVRADVNADGAVDLKDITLLMRHLAGGWNVEIEVANADVNADGNVDLRDAVLMRRYLVGGWDVVLA